VAVYAQTKANQKIDVRITGSSNKIEVFKKDMDNNTRLRFEQTRKLNGFSDLTIFVNDTLQAHLSNNSKEESFRMLTTSQENDYNINPITFDDSKLSVILNVLDPITLWVKKKKKRSAVKGRKITYSDVFFVFCLLA